MKGGYKIIDFKNVSLSGTPVTMTNVLVDLLNNYDKVVLLSHVVLSGSAKDDCFSAVLSDGAGGVKLNCYDGYISINSSGAVTYTVASASGMASDIAELAAEIGDLEELETTDKDSVVEAINETIHKFSYYCKISYVDLTGTSDASSGSINTALNISDVIPVFAINITSGGYAKFYEIYSTASGDIKLMQHPWDDLTVTEKGVQYNIRLYYLSKGE